MEEEGEGGESEMEEEGEGRESEEKEEGEGGEEKRKEWCERKGIEGGGMYSNSSTTQSHDSHMTRKGEDSPFFFCLMFSGSS